jgi:hypothetical protein
VTHALLKPLQVALQAELTIALRGVFADRERHGLDLPGGEAERIVQAFMRRVDGTIAQRLLDGYGIDRYHEYQVVVPTQSGERPVVQVDEWEVEEPTRRLRAVGK